MSLFKVSVVVALLCPAVFSSAIPSELFSKRSSCQVGSRTTNGKLYTVTCNVDRPGGDYSAQRYDSCNADSRCVSATYHEDNGYCYFKNTLTYESVAAGESTVVLGTGCVNRTRMLNSRTCNVQCGVDIHGGDWINKRTESFEACAQLCSSYTWCYNAEYRESTGYCYLKDTQSSSISADPDVETIVCDAAPTTPTVQHAANGCPYEGPSYAPGYLNCTYNSFCDTVFINQDRPLTSYGSATTLKDCLQSLAMNGRRGEAVAMGWDPAYGGLCKIYGTHHGVEPGQQVAKTGGVTAFFNKDSCYPLN